MELIYAELTVVWVVTVALGAVLAVYHTGLVAFDAVKNLVENRRLRAMTSRAVSPDANSCIEAAE